MSLVLLVWGVPVEMLAIFTGKIEYNSWCFEFCFLFPFAFFFFLRKFYDSVQQREGNISGRFFSHSSSYSNAFFQLKLMALTYSQKGVGRELGAHFRKFISLVLLIWVGWILFWRFLSLPADNWESLVM